MSDTKLRTPCSKESHGKWEADDTSGLIGRSQAGIANCHHPHPEGPSTAEQLIDGGEARGSGGPETISETRGPARQETAEARPPAQNLQGESSHTRVPQRIGLRCPHRDSINSHPGLTVRTTGRRCSQCGCSAPVLIPLSGLQLGELESAVEVKGERTSAFFSLHASDWILHGSFELTWTEPLQTK